MNKILFLSFLLMLISCGQDTQIDPVETEPINYSLFSHTGFDTLPAQNVTILIDGDKFSGQGPINRYFGSIKENQIFQPIGSTMMAGPDRLMKYEHLYFSALDSVTLQGIGTDTLEISKAGKVQLVFVRDKVSKQ
jgi:heat shock protein HslJ